MVPKIDRLKRILDRQIGLVEIVRVGRQLVITPDVPVSVDVTSHCHIVHEHIYNAMCDAFPKDRAVVKSKGLSDDHLDIFFKARKAKKKLASAFDRFFATNIWGKSWLLPGIVT